MRDQYINSGQGFLLVYSITTKRSLETIREMKDKILQVKEAEKFPMVLVGNKCDLESERKVTLEEGKDLAKTWNIGFFETSAKARINIEESFMELVTQVLNFESESPDKTSDAGPQRPTKAPKSKKGGSTCNLL